jgi:hypothetical protein
VTASEKNFHSPDPAAFSQVLQVLVEAWREINDIHSDHKPPQNKFANFSLSDYFLKFIISLWKTSTTSLEFARAPT